MFLLASLPQNVQKTVRNVVNQSDWILGLGPITAEIQFVRSETIVSQNSHERLGIPNSRFRRHFDDEKIVVLHLKVNEFFAEAKNGKLLFRRR